MSPRSRDQRDTDPVPDPIKELFDSVEATIIGALHTLEDRMVEHYERVTRRLDQKDRTDADLDRRLRVIERRLGIVPPPPRTPQGLG